jgi:hypothetical protein
MSDMRNRLYEVNINGEIRVYPGKAMAELHAYMSASRFLSEAGFDVDSLEGDLLKVAAEENHHVSVKEVTLDLD